MNIVYTDRRDTATLKLEEIALIKVQKWKSGRLIDRIPSSRWMEHEVNIVRFKSGAMVLSLEPVKGLKIRLRSLGLIWRALKNLRCFT